MPMPTMENCFYYARLSPVGMVTGNMFAICYRDPKYPDKDGECVVIDAGICLEGNAAGFKVPDITYLSALRKGTSPLGKFKIVGLIISHGHDDHLAALPYVLKQLGNPKVYGSPFTIELCKLLESYDNFKSQLHVVKPTDNAIKLGKYFKAYLIHVTHSIPDASHIVLKIADQFTYYHAADFKLDPYPIDHRPTDMNTLSRFAKDNIDLLAVDCVRVTEPAFTKSETDIFPNLRHEMRRVEGNIYVTTFSSHIHRIQQIINSAVEEGRKIVFLGKSVRGKTALAITMGYLKIPKDSLFNSKQVEEYHYRDSNLCIIAAGCQGQWDSAMLKLMYRGVACLKIKTGDKVIISASCIPGNSQIYFSVVEELTKRGIPTVYPNAECQIHTSGHASAGDLKRFISFFKNTANLMPISGEIQHNSIFADKVALPYGYSAANRNLILPETGQVLAISKANVRVADTFDVHMECVDRANDHQN